jgi:hypothetical protein
MNSCTPHQSCVLICKSPELTRQTQLVLLRARVFLSGLLAAEPLLRLLSGEVVVDAQMLLRVHRRGFHAHSE